MNNNAINYKLEEEKMNDKRKAYHALTFADQALNYWNRYRDTQAIEYLKTSDMWLDAEEKSSPWNRNLKRLKDIIKKKLEQITGA